MEGSPLSINPLIIAWIGQGDFGDEAMAFALRLFLKKILGLSKSTYYQCGAGSLYRHPDDISFSCMHRFGTPAIINNMRDLFLLRRYNALIMGGGSILHSANSIRWKADILERVLHRSGRSTAGCMGVSLGPFGNDIARNLCAEFLERCNFVLCRDSFSAACARDLSPRTTVLDSLDLSLLIPSLCPGFLPEHSRQRDEDLIGVIVVKKNGQERIFKEQAHLEKFTLLVNWLLKKGYRVKLFTLYTGKAYDDGVLNRMLERSSSYPERITTHTFDGDIARTIGALGRCRAVVSMRLHGIIFSYTLGIPFLSLGYNPKNRYFCDSIGYPEELVFDMHDITAADPLMEALELLLGMGDMAFASALSVNTAAEKVLADTRTVGSMIAGVL